MLIKETSQLFRYRELSAERLKPMINMCQSYLIIPLSCVRQWWFCYYVTGEWVIKQKVCRSILLAKSLTGEELAYQIIMVLSTELGIPSSQVIPEFMTELP